MPPLVVTVSYGGLEVLRFDGAAARVSIAPANGALEVVAALAKAIEVFTAHQPTLSPVAAGVDAVEKLAGTVDPAVVADGFAAIDATVVALRDRIETASATRITH